MSKTYSLSTWDPEDDEGEGDFTWFTRAEGLSLWALRGAIREYRSRGYSRFSMLVCSEEPVSIPA